MKAPLLIVTISFSLSAFAQGTRPADIHPQTLSRLPPVERSQLDDEGKRIWDFITNNGTVPMSAPPRIAMYSPKAAELNNTLNRHLRATVNGVRYFELCTLIAARAFDQQYEWSAHEPAGLQAGLPQSVIDVVKYDRDVAGLPEKDATVIRLGRAIFRDHRVSSELWAKTVQLFGQRGAVEIVLTLGEYAMTAVMLTAVDQQLPPERKPLLPEKK